MLQQQLAASHLAEEEKRQWLESQQEAAAARASYARQLAVRDAHMRSQVEAEANAHLAKVTPTERCADGWGGVALLSSIVVSCTPCVRGTQLDVNVVYFLCQGHTARYLCRVLPVSGAHS